MDVPLFGGGRDRDGIYSDLVQPSCPQGCIMKTPVKENVLAPIAADLSAHDICKAADAETMGLCEKV